uniref:Ribonuclease A-domain domain-containing protein n=1 Tax=Leptobrachium leishanense TaxID=445787 RepID=A0A8C5QQI3_9ANUR
MLPHVKNKQNGSEIKKQHIVKVSNIDCTEIMWDRRITDPDGAHCKPINTFIYSTDNRSVKNICNGSNANKDLILSRKIFNLTVCIKPCYDQKRKPACVYSTTTDNSPICVNCEGVSPSHLYPKSENKKCKSNMMDPLNDTPNDRTE